MKSFAFVATALVAPALAVPTSIPITKRAGAVKAGSYIVKLKDGVSKDAHVASLQEYIGSQDSKVVYKYESSFNGYAGVFKGSVLDYVRQSPDVEYIEADSFYSLEFEQGNESLATREVHTGDETAQLVGRDAAGEGVDIYHLDTGIRLTHECFGGRASWGATFGGYESHDGMGHGTHTAGLAVGVGFGRATKSKITAVKVCSDDPICLASDIIAGINYAVNRTAIANRPSIITMSLAVWASTAVDDAVNNAISHGIHCVAAAGNENQDVANLSPAGVPGVNTVGAIDYSNQRASWSNFGPLLDVWAPGVNVTSAWNTSDTATYTWSGTSMSAPDVTGILAVVISKYGNSSPAKLSADLKSHAQPVVIGAPDNTTNLKATLW